MKIWADVLKLNQSEITAIVAAVHSLSSLFFNKSKRLKNQAVADLQFFELLFDLLSRHNCELNCSMPLYLQCISNSGHNLSTHVASSIEELKLSTQVQSEYKSSFPKYAFGQGFSQRPLMMEHTVHAVGFIKQEAPNFARGVVTEK